MKQDGGQAFPSQWVNDDQGGMKLRDYFAAKAMAAIQIGVLIDDTCARAVSKHVESTGGTFVGVIAADAYAMAEAMLAERVK